MTSPAASLRGGAVGALTVALAVAAHGMAGGGYPSGSATVFLLIVAIGVGAIASMPNPRSSRSQLATVLGGLLLGQSASHIALAVGNPLEMMHGHSIVPSATMIGFHLAASAATAVLVCAAEGLYGPVTSIVRAVLDPPLPLPGVSTGPFFVGNPEKSSLQFFGTSISRRGPPVSV